MKNAIALCLLGFALSTTATLPEAADAAAADEIAAQAQEQALDEAAPPFGQLRDQGLANRALLPLGSGSVSIRGGPLEFPDQFVDAGPTDAFQVTIVNVGSDRLYFVGAGIELTTVPHARLVRWFKDEDGLHTGNDHFIVTRPSLEPMEPGESRVVTIAFDPASAGMKYAELRVTTTDPDSPVAKVRMGGIGLIRYVPQNPIDGTIQVTLGPKRELSPDFLGYNGNMFTGTQAEANMPWTNPDIRAAVASLNPSTIKYPAGTFGNYWDWDIDWIDQTFPGIWMANTNEVRQFWCCDSTPPDVRYPVSHFAEMLYQPYGIKAVFQLNSITKGQGQAGLDHALRGLSMAEAAGLPIKWVELGNKASNTDEDPYNPIAFPTGTDYARFCLQWGAAIKARFPGVKVLAAANYSNSLAAPERSLEFNRLLAETLGDSAVVDSWKIHFYTLSGFNLSSVNRDLEWAAFAGEEGAARMMGQPYRYVDLLFGLNYWPENQKITIATSQSLDRPSITNGTWAHGLLLATIANIMLSNDLVQSMGIQNVMDNQANQAAIYRGTTGMNHVPASVRLASGQGPNWATAPYSLSAVGEAMSLFNTAMRGMTEARPMHFVPEVIVQPHIHYQINPYPGIFGHAFTNGEKSSAVLVNVTDKTYTVETQHFAPRGAPFLRKEGNPTHTYKTYVMNAASLVKTTGQTEDVMALPPFSITVIGPF